MTICAIDDCDRDDIQGNGWCRMHYIRWYRTGDPGEASRRQRPEKDICTIDGCDKPDDGPHGLCQMHMSRLKRNGDPLALRGPKIVMGTNNTKWIGDDVGLHGLHNRIYVRRGKASTHKCVDCGAQAKHWSYDHKDPNEKQSPQGTYSTNIDHYQPRCVPCHKTFDLKIRQCHT